MFKLLIADDEPKIRRGLAECFQWEALGFDVCGLAKNGLELIELSTAERPDLCLVDICMPHLDGLDAVRSIRKTLPDCRFIIISGHGEFEYAQKAMESGVEGYLLKPIDERKLLDMVEKVKESLDSQKQNALLMRMARKRIEALRPQLFQDFIKDWLEERIPSEELAEELNFWGMDGSSSWGILLIDHPVRASIGQSPSENRERLFALYQGIEEQLQDQPCLWVPITPRTTLGVLPKGEAGPLGFVEDDSLDVFGTSLGLDVRALYRGMDPKTAWFPEIIAEMQGELEAIRQASPVVVEVRRIIDLEYMEKELSLQSVADRLHVSVSHLSRLFREETGVGFAEYLIRTRVHRAIELMATTDARIGDVSDQVGYRSPHYFSNAFKKVTGYSPQEYRATRGGLL